MSVFSLSRVSCAARVLCFGCSSPSSRLAWILSQSLNASMLLYMLLTKELRNAEFVKWVSKRKGIVTLVTVLSVSNPSSYEILRSGVFDAKVNE